MKETVERANLNWSELSFDYRRTDGHVEQLYSNGEWSEARVVEDDTIRLPIAATCLHYGQECFEGLKAFETRDGRVVLFRPRDNARRMIHTAEKIHMVPPSEDDFVAACEKVVRINRRYVPPYGSGASLYLRPLLIGISPIIGVRPSLDYLFLVFATPVGPYFKGGLKPIRLIVMEDCDRAAPHGLGDAKTGGNYAAGLRGLLMAKERGFAEALYLDPAEHRYIEETGASNFFGITRDGAYVTPDSSSILPSITNRSLMQVAEDLGLRVERRRIPVEELEEFVEVGAVGTAAVITPVHAIQYRDRLFTYGDEDHVGETTRRLYERLTGIQHGDVEDAHGWTHEVTFE